MTTSHVDNPAVQQLWGRALATGDYRIVARRSPSPTWEQLRTFRVLGLPSRPALLVERGDDRAVARALLAYGGLRTWKARTVRAAAAGASWLGTPSFGQDLFLERRPGADLTVEPLTGIAAALHRPVLAHIGVRSGANAKPTAQLFTPAGAPVGYAKLAWNDLTAAFVQTETARLQMLGGRAGKTQTPRVIASGTTGGLPFFVSEPLPLGVRQLQQPDDLSIEALCTLSPVLRTAVPRTSGHLASIVHRLEQNRAHPLLRRVEGPLLDLARRLAGSQHEVPILSFDHGDLVPWNTCRDADGTVWLWDWESSQTDTLAGSDALHWLVHAIHGPRPRDLVAGLHDVRDRAAQVHRGLGMGFAASHVAVAFYVLHSCERSAQWALGHATWERNRIGEDDILGLTALGRASIDRATDIPVRSP